MKRIFKFLSILIFAACLFAVAVIPTHAAEAEEPVATVTGSAGAYILSGIGEERSFSSLSELINEVEDCRILFLAVNTSENITVKSSLSLSGSLAVDGSVTIDGAEVGFNNFDLTVSDGTLEIKGARLLAENTRITLERASIAMNYSAPDLLEMRECSVIARSDKAALALEMGTVRLIDTSVVSEHSYAVESRGSLYLCGKSLVKGYGWDVYTERPIHLSYEDKPFLENLSVLWGGTFSKGGLYQVLLDCDKDMAGRISLFSLDAEQFPLTYFEDSERCSEKRFIAVSLPYKFTYYSSGAKYLEEYYYSDELTASPAAAERVGYRFLAWHNRQTGDVFDFGKRAASDIILDAAFALTPPTYSIADISEEYSGKEYTLSFDYVSHPLLSEGAVSYSWYKNGESINSSLSELKLSKVADSGEYNCKLTFAYKGDIVTVDTKTVSVSISKKQLEIPHVEPLVYNGKKQMPHIEESQYYTAYSEGGTERGFYPVSFILIDTENTAWSYSQESVEYAVFEIKKAENHFLRAPEALTVYEGEKIEISYLAAFGEGRVLYSQNGVDYEDTAPGKAGEYFAVVEVEEAESYTALRSEPIRLYIIQDTPGALVVEKSPDRISYVAFDIPDLGGIRVKAIMKSGNEIYLEPEQISVIYANGCYLSALDSCVYLEYQGASVPLGVSVGRREYSLSDLRFDSAEVIYNGRRHTLTASGEIMGLDGIALGYEIKGGGINVGEYEIRAVFSTESAEYEIPEDELRTLKILPMPVTLTYGDLAFVYDGTPKIPFAIFTDAGGATRSVTLTGRGTCAGEYTARAESTDRNYVFLNPTVPFVVEKARIDISQVEFSEGRLVYNGKKQSVSVLKLPNSLTLVGYINAGFVDTGSYTAEVIVDYDEDNYYPPERILYRWEILPAEYDFSAFTFPDSEFVFDGEEHYPKPLGALPRGLDGSSPSFTFSGGARHVSEGWVTVTVSFSSGSKNYNAPKSIVSRVRITPKAIAVQWSGSEFVYDGKEKLPLAYSHEAEITVSGAAAGAGEYTAEAVSISRDYKIINSTFAYKIKKAENAWLTLPVVTSSFHGKKITLDAKALSGDVKYKIFCDKEMQTEANYPLSVNNYFLFAYVEEGENYLRLSCEPIEFAVVPIVATGIEITLLKNSFVALDSVLPDDFVAKLKYNDGSEEALASSEVSVDMGASALRMGEVSVTFSYLDFSSEVIINVAGRELDLSGAFWDSTEHFYSGEVKVATLKGLPEGVSVKNYILNSATDAGVYRLSCELEYDSDYYILPSVPEDYLIIKKATVTLPEVPDLVYNGTEQSPDIANNALYTVSFTPAKRAGEYEIKITLTDPENYSLPEGGLKYRILPCEIELSVDKGGKSYTLTKGKIIPGDSLGEEYYTENGTVLLKISNPDYTVKVIGRDKLGGGFILLIVLLLIILALAVYVLVGRRDLVFAMGKKSNPTAEKAEEPKSPEKAEPKGEKSELGTLFEVDEDAANRLISDMLAKDLVKEERKRVRTEGRRRGYVNLGKISECFESGAKIDINAMKEKGIVSKDVCHIKVLGGGVLDKPLHIMANSFSLSAIKMIALTGGTAERVINIK